MAFHLIDMETWERREHYKYYQTMVHSSYTLNAHIKITELLKEIKNRELRFYPVFLYVVSTAVNRIREMRMAHDSEHRLGYWDECHPSYTIFHEDDHTFSDIWSFYDEDFRKCYENIVSDMETYKDCKGPKGKPGQPPNFYCISCVPWMDFTGYGTWVPGGEPSLFPIITFGKYTDDRGKKELSAALTISHAAADGYHASMLFQDIQNILSEAVL